MSKKIGINYLYTVSYQLLSIIIPFITAPYLSRILGVKKIGEYSFANSIVYYFILVASFGTATYGRREISYLQTNKQARDRKFWEIEIISCISVVLCLVIYIICLNTKSATLIYYILAVDIFSVALDISWFFQGMEEFGRIVIRNTFFKIFNVIFILTMVKTQNDLGIYVLGLVLTALLSNLSLWCYIPKYISKPNFKDCNFKDTFWAIATLFVPTIAVFLYSSIDKTMIGIICKDPIENGYYEQASKMVRIILTLVTSMVMVVSPRISYHTAHSDKSKVNFYMYKSYNFVFFLGIPLCLGMICIAQSFVPWFYGKEFYGAIPLLKVLSFLILAIGINNITGTQYLISTRRQYKYTKTVCLGVIINLVCNFLLIPHYKALGAAAASVISEMSIALIQFYVVRKELDLKSIFKSSGNYFLSGGVMMFLLNIEKRFVPPSALGTGILVLTGGVIYFSILIIIKDNFLYSLIKGMMNKIFKQNY